MSKVLCLEVDGRGVRLQQVSGRSRLIKSDQQQHPSAARRLKAADPRVCDGECFLFPVCSQTFNTRTMWDYAERPSEVFQPPPSDKHTCK